MDASKIISYLGDLFENNNGDIYVLIAKCVEEHRVARLININTGKVCNKRKVVIVIEQDGEDRRGYITDLPATKGWFYNHTQNICYRF